MNELRKKERKKERVEFKQMNELKKKERKKV